MVKPMIEKIPNWEDYLDGIFRGYEEGHIQIDPEEQVNNVLEMLRGKIAGKQVYDTEGRRMKPAALHYMRALGDESLRFLSMGHGWGIEASTVRHHFPDADISTLGQIPISPYHIFSSTFLSPDLDEFGYWTRKNACVLGAKDNNHVTFGEVMDGQVALEEPIIEEVERPYIQTEMCYDLKGQLPGEYDFIYNSFGPLEAKHVRTALASLSERGAFFVHTAISLLHRRDLKTDGLILDSGKDCFLFTRRDFPLNGELEKISTAQCSVGGVKYRVCEKLLDT